MWFIYTMEYYAAEKNNDIMKFSGKWMELENVILSKCYLTQSPFPYDNIASNWYFLHQKHLQEILKTTKISSHIQGGLGQARGQHINSNLSMRFCLGSRLAYNPFLQSLHFDFFVKGND
ncbi:hypothetical protein STEG23_031379 [Scotinomys teguina]